MSRILILGINYAPEPTGNAPYTTGLAEGLAKMGHTVHVVTGYPHYPDWRLKQGYRGWVREEVINGISVKRLRHYIPTTASAFSRMHMEISFGIRLLCTRWHGPDVVLVVSPALFSSALGILRAKLSLRRPAVAIWVQDLYSKGLVETGTGGRLSANLASRVESLILRSADGVAAIHERFKTHMVDTLRVPEERVRVIRNWTHLPALPKTGATDMRMQLGWAPDDIIVLHAGNMGKKQGLENVIQAARVADSRGSAVRFVLMGDGNQRRRLQTTAEGITRISFLDPLPKLDFQRALSAADVLLVNELPGVKDMSVPSKLTSYFNAGVPIVAATDELSVTGHEIDRSGGGVCVPAGDPLALVEAVEALATNRPLALRLVNNALRFCQETLSESAAVATYDGFISTLASSRDRQVV